MGRDQCGNPNVINHPQVITTFTGGCVRQMVGLWHWLSHISQDSVARQDGPGDIHVVDVHLSIRLGQQRQGNIEDRLSHVARPEYSVIL